MAKRELVEISMFRIQVAKPIREDNSLTMARYGAYVDLYLIMEKLNGYSIDNIDEEQTNDFLIINANIVDLTKKGRVYDQKYCGD